VSQAKDPDEIIEKKYDPETVRKIHEAEDAAAGITKATREEMEEFKRANPGSTDYDYWKERDWSRAIENKRKALLRFHEARGWNFQRYRADELLDEDIGSDSPTRVLRGVPTADKFLIIEIPAFGIKRSFVTAHSNIIRMESTEDPGNSNLRRFFQVNNRFLQDVDFSKAPGSEALGHRGTLSSIQTERFPRLQRSNAIVITGAGLGDGKEILTVFDLSEAAQTGALRGDMYTVDPAKKGRSIDELLIRRLANNGPKRVYYYGDDLEQIDVSAICDRLEHEMLRRSPDVPRDLIRTENRLSQLANRNFQLDQLAIVDGLPQDREAAEAMGLFAGDWRDWSDFNTRVQQRLQGHAIRHVTGQDEFFHELQHGESDMLILIAHSTGKQLYLNGRKISFKKLQDLHPRETASARPRVAVLITCDAGKTKNVSLHQWWLELLRGPVWPLAQILIDKGFVDKVIAPDHKIRAEESLTVLQRALDGARPRSIFRNWVNWAADWLRLWEPAA
jgi:hypothetical protein